MILKCLELLVKFAIERIANLKKKASFLDNHLYPFHRCRSDASEPTLRLDRAGRVRGFRSYEIFLVQLAQWLPSVDSPGATPVGK